MPGHLIHKKPRVQSGSIAKEEAEDLGGGDGGQSVNQTDQEKTVMKQTAALLQVGYLCCREGTLDMQKKRVA